MKILNRKQFMDLDGEHVFAKYHPCICGSLSIKVPYDGPDFTFQDLDPVGMIDSEGSDDLFDKLLIMDARSQSYPVDLHASQRDGMFDEEQLFMVLEKDDVLKLINRLQEVLDE